MLTIGKMKMQQRRMSGRYTAGAVLTLLLHLCAFCGIGAAGVPSVSHVELTDVTPGSFAVTWVSSEPATGTLSMYQSNCSTPLTGLSMMSEGNDTTGSIRVAVSGLSADTTYCYRTVTVSKSTSDNTTYPAQPVSVSTAKAVKRVMASGPKNVPFANDLLRVPDVYLPTGSVCPDGVLDLLYLTGTKSPVSLLLTGDSKKRYFNMNNLFDSTTGETINLVGGERVMISERHGRSGCVIERFRKVPADQETTRIRDFTANPRRQDIDFNGSVNILDVLRVAAGVGTKKGDPCFNSELDLMGHDKVDQSDLSSVIGGFDGTP